MTPQEQLIHGTLDEAIEMLAKTAVVHRRIKAMQKEAQLPSWLPKNLDELGASIKANPHYWGPALGALGGGAFGLATDLSREKKRRQTLRRTLSGIAGGGALGLAAGVGIPAILKSMEGQKEKTAPPAPAGVPVRWPTRLGALAGEVLDVADAGIRGVAGEAAGHPGAAAGAGVGLGLAGLLRRSASKGKFSPDGRPDLSHNPKTWKYQVERVEAAGKNAPTWAQQLKNVKLPTFSGTEARDYPQFLADLVAGKNPYGLTLQDAKKIMSYNEGGLVGALKGTPRETGLAAVVRGLPLVGTHSLAKFNATQLARTDPGLATGQPLGEAVYRLIGETAARANQHASFDPTGKVKLSPGPQHSGLIRGPLIRVGRAARGSVASLGTAGKTRVGRATRGAAGLGGLALLADQLWRWRQFLSPGPGTTTAPTP